MEALIENIAHWLQNEASKRDLPTKRSRFDPPILLANDSDIGRQFGGDKVSVHDLYAAAELATAKKHEDAVIYFEESIDSVQMGVFWFAKRFDYRPAWMTAA